jgi:hypothetical protein
MKRIAIFREDIAIFPILFVIHLTTNQLPISLYEILTKRSRCDDWQLLAINTSEGAFDLPAKLPERLHLAHVRYPSPDFVWHLAGDLATLAGYAFERRIVAAVRPVLVANFRRRF